MEDAVTKEVNTLYEQLKTEHITWLNCDCETCRLDTICYVLNRTQPKYSVSERGVLHNALDMEDSQLKADITSLALEGIRIINSSKRAYHDVNLSKENPVTDENTRFYNFPIVIGTVYDGSSFEPLDNARIVLKIDGENAVMSDSTWSNPAKTYKSTKGSYSFWPKSVECSNKEETKIFKLIFEISAANYETSTYAVELPLVPEAQLKSSLENTYSLKIKDIFLFNPTSSDSSMD